MQIPMKTDPEEQEKQLLALKTETAERSELLAVPVTGPVKLKRYLESGLFSRVLCGGASGREAPICDYEWILDIRRQCISHGIAFSFVQTGSRFRMNGHLYQIRPEQEKSQAQKAGIDYEPDGLFERLARSRFRSRFALNSKDRAYLEEKGEAVIEEHAREFIRKRLAPAVIPNDGKQTPMRGHPVFPAQHATATCCRGCLFKWHHIPPGRELTQEEQDYVVGVIMEWIRRQEKK